jgi:large subunit ribosomal protein L18
MKKAVIKQNRRVRRKRRVRKHVEGTASQPRLATFRSLRHIYAQIVDDQAGVTLVASSTRSDKLSDDQAGGGNIDAAKKVGQALAGKALSLGITKVCFDRNGYKYHGRVKALAEAAREAGLKF